MYRMTNVQEQYYMAPMNNLIIPESYMGRINVALISTISHVLITPYSRNNTQQNYFLSHSSLKFIFGCIRRDLYNKTESSILLKNFFFPKMVINARAYTSKPNVIRTCIEHHFGKKTCFYKQVLKFLSECPF